jgi:hypothetical protein
MLQALLKEMLIVLWFLLDGKKSEVYIYLFQNSYVCSWVPWFSTTLSKICIWWRASRGWFAVAQGATSSATAKQDVAMPEMVSGSLAYCSS